MCSSVRAVYRIPAEADAPGQARRIVDAEFAPFVPGSVLERVKLLIFEFVSNRIANGVATPMTLDVRAEDTVRCAIIDRGQAALPPMSVIGAAEKLGMNWGLSRDAAVTRVWFETQTARATASQNG